jgi:hypothetical protein
MKGSVALGRLCLALAAVLGASAASPNQTNGDKLSFTAVAVANNNLAAGAGTVLIDVTRWSTPEDARELADTLRQKGPQALLSKLQDARPTGTIRTPDSLAYDLRFASRTPTPEGGSRIVLATDRPIGFWEARSGSRTLDYPFTVVQMEIEADGKGKGTLSVATRIEEEGDAIELENFASAPIMLTEVHAATSK